jgi:hypothetical protein
MGSVVNTAMTFGEFLEFVQRYENGSLWDDHAYKNYDLLHMSSDKRMQKALAMCGFTEGELSVSLSECHTRVKERGHGALGRTEVRRLLLEWYVWRKITRGEYRTWKYRKSVLTTG